MITLLEPHELQIAALGEEVRRRHMEWHHWPIVDVSTPCSRFEATWQDASGRIRSLLEKGGGILISDTQALTWAGDRPL